MTFAGKILVIVMMAMSLIFLGISTVALTTSTDWKAAIARQNKANQEIQAQLTTAQADLQNFQGRLETAKKEHAVALGPVDAQIKKLRDEEKTGQATIEESSKTLLKHESEAKGTLEDVKTKNDDIIKLRQDVESVSEQGRQFQTRQEELDAEIVNLQRMLDAAKINTSQIRQPR
jgi:chromosome segregation ATPase